MNDRMKEKEKRKRFVWCTLLLTVLVVSAVHTEEREVQTAALPVSRVEGEFHEVSEMTTKTARESILERRMKEIELPDAVLCDPDATKEIREDALSQKNDIERRMEFETQAQACMENMGIKESAALFGTQNMTVCASFEYVSEEKQRTSIIDAVSSITGLAPDSIKIILAKNE